jgi:ribosome maturation protein Sdo1
MAKRRVSSFSLRGIEEKPTNQVVPSSEPNLDDVLQISNVFTNVSKGEVAKSNDLQKAFGTSTVDKVVSEVSSFFLTLTILTERRRSSRKEKYKLGRRSATTISHHYAKKLLRSSPISPSTQLHKPPTQWV